MKLLMTLFLAFSATLATVVVASYDLQSELKLSEIEEATSLRGVSRFLAQQKFIANMTCDKFPCVCRQIQSSLWPDCCKRKCVNVKTDRFNRVMCGYKCKYTEICCKGQCVNTSFDKRKYGGCNKKC